MSSAEELERSVPTKKDLALSVDETRKELHAAGKSVTDIGTLALCSVGLTVVAFGIIYFMRSVGQFDLANSIGLIVGVMDLVIFIGIISRVFTVGKHLRLAGTDNLPE